MAQLKQYTKPWLIQSHLHWYAPGSNWNLKLTLSSHLKYQHGSTDHPASTVVLHLKEKLSATAAEFARYLQHSWKSMASFPPQHDEKVFFYPFQLSNSPNKLHVQLPNSHYTAHEHFSSHSFWELTITVALVLSQMTCTLVVPFDFIPSREGIDNDSVYHEIEILTFFQLIFWSGGKNVHPGHSLQHLFCEYPPILNLGVVRNWICATSTLQFKRIYFLGSRLLQLLGKVSQEHIFLSRLHNCISHCLSFLHQISKHWLFTSTWPNSILICSCTHETRHWGQGIPKLRRNIVSYCRNVYTWERWPSSFFMHTQASNTDSVVTSPPGTHKTPK